MKNKLLIGLLLLALVQLYVPLSMIIKRENVLKHGERFTFITAPVDPIDAFRGRYVALRIRDNYIVKQGAQGFEKGRCVYLTIGVDEQGFSRFSSISSRRPAGKTYLRAKAGYTSGDKIYLELPFERYYMQEKAAPAAEAAYRRYSQQAKQDAYIVVRVKEGVAVIENLYLGGRRIEDALKEKN